VRGHDGTKSATAAETPVAAGAAAETVRTRAAAATMAAATATGSVRGYARTVSTSLPVEIAKKTRKAKVE